MQAIETSAAADEYYKKLSAVIDPADKARWEAEIMNAENDRRDHIAAMDILKAKHVDATATAGAVASIPEGSDAARWIQLAIILEEKQ